MIVLGFERESQADEVFLALTQMGSKQRLIDLEDSTVVFRDREGKVQFGRIKQDRSQPEDHLGAGLATGGSLMGLLVGALMQHPLLETAMGTVIGQQFSFCKRNLKKYSVKDKNQGFVRNAQSRTKSKIN